MMENDDHELHHAMDRAKNAPSEENLQHLIKKLQEKLDDDHQILLENRLSTTEATSSKTEDDEGFLSSKSLNTDTIVLVGSLIVMILIGLIFHRIISYLAKLRGRRQQYQRSLKQLGEHMHIVTRTISNPASASNTPTGTPSIALRKLAALNNNNNNNNKHKKKASCLPASMVTTAAVNVHASSSSSSSQIPDDDNSVFKPSTHVMRREDSALGTMTTAAQLRHQELHAHHDDTDDDED